MIQYPAGLLAVGGARTGIAPVNLLDVQTVDGDQYLWSDRVIQAPPAILPTQPIAMQSVGPPVPVPPGQMVAWAYPTTVAAQSAAYGSANATLTSAFLSVNGSALNAGTSLVGWSNFAMPPLPADAVIQGAYPVFIASGTGAGALNFAENSNLPGTGEFNGQYLSTTLAPAPVSAAAITGATVQISIEDSVPPYGPDTIYQDVTVSFIGIAIYYTSSSVGLNGLWTYDPWLLSVPSFAFHRSLQTDVGSCLVQNISGDTLSRDFEKLWRAEAFEGAFFIYRLWQPDVMAPWIEVHGTLTVEAAEPDTVQLKGMQLLNPAQDDTPLEIYCETCQLNWAGKRCGSTQTTECLYSYQSCQVIERIMVVMNDYEKNYGETIANTALNVINRRRRI